MINHLSISLQASPSNPSPVLPLVIISQLPAPGDTARFTSFALCLLPEMSRVPWQLFLPLALALLVLLAPERAQAGKYSWPGWKLEDREYAWAREAIYLRKDAPAAVSNDRSYIDLQCAVFFVCCCCLFRVVSV